MLALHIQCLFRTVCQPSSSGTVSRTRRLVGCFSDEAVDGRLESYEESVEKVDDLPDLEECLA